MKHAPLLFFFVLFTAFAASHEAQGQYQAQIDRLKAQDLLNPPPENGIVFVGSSSIYIWEQLTRDFAHYDTIQRGFGGSEFSDLNFFVAELVLDYNPTAVVVWEGTNDIAFGKSPATVFQDYLEFVDLVHQGQDQTLPPIKIFYIGITPTPARWSLWPLASALNDMIETHAAGDPSLFYHDIPTPFLQTGMPPSTSLFIPDQLHLNQAGYDIWTGVIRPDIEAVVPRTKTYRPTGLQPAIGQRILFDFGPDDVVNGNRTNSPDPNGNYWNNWHPNSGGGIIYSGEHLGNLVTSAGVPSGVDMIMSGEATLNGIQNGGLLDPSALLLGHLAAPTATQDYFIAGLFPYQGGFYLRGLDPSLRYDLRFFATRATNETRITRFNLKGRSTAFGDLQTSGVGIGSNGSYNGNDDEILVIPKFSPDRFGQIFVDVERLQGSFSYFGAMEIVVRGPRPVRHAPAPISK